MLNSEERRWIYRHAYLPEHLPDYVCAVSGAEPYLINNYLCFIRKQHLIFIGYPLDSSPDDISRSYEAACERFQPSAVAIVAPQIWLPDNTYDRGPTDRYYRLDLPVGLPDPAVTYMVRRAARQVRVTDRKFDREHRKLVDRFLAAHEFTSEQTYIYKRLKQYHKKSESACLLEARFPVCRHEWAARVQFPSSRRGRRRPWDHETCGRRWLAYRCRDPPHPL